MAKDFYILSTLTADQEYTAYNKGGGDLPIPAGSVLIAGGANVANKRNLVTPQGVVTKVSADQLAMLESNEVFQLHKANGYITVSERKPSDPDAAAASQASRDGSAPMVENDFEEGKAPVSVGSASTEGDKGGAQRSVSPSNPRRA